MMKVCIIHEHERVSPSRLFKKIAFLDKTTASSIIHPSLPTLIIIAFHVATHAVVVHIILRRGIEMAHANMMKIATWASMFILQTDMFHRRFH